MQFSPVENFDAFKNNYKHPPSRFFCNFFRSSSASFLPQLPIAVFLHKYRFFAETRRKQFPKKYKIRFYSGFFTLFQTLMLHFRFFSGFFRLFPVLFEFFTLQSGSIFYGEKNKSCQNLIPLCVSFPSVVCPWVYFNVHF